MSRFSGCSPRRSWPVSVPEETVRRAVLCAPLAVGGKIPTVRPCLRPLGPHLPSAGKGGRGAARFLVAPPLRQRAGSVLPLRSPRFLLRGVLPGSLPSEEAGGGRAWSCRSPSAPPPAAPERDKPGVSGAGRGRSGPDVRGALSQGRLGWLCLDSFLSNSVARVLGGSRLQEGRAGPREAQRLVLGPWPPETFGLQDPHLQTRLRCCPLLAARARAGSLATTRCGGDCPHFADMETEAQRWEATRLCPHGR